MKMSAPLAVLASMRPRQWTKNLILFAPLIFAAKFTDATAIGRALAGFGLFCLVSGAVYLINDVRDIENDRRHERKRSRPIASGALSARAAVAVAVALVALALAGSFALSVSFGLAASVYLGLQLAYTFFLKDQVILDVMAISAGFVVRAVAGSLAISVVFSPWLLSCAALLALFLALGKRRHELLLLEMGAEQHRRALADYSPQLIDQLTSAITAATIVTYALYTFFSPASQTHQYLMLTVPFVVYGLFRYLYLVHQRNLGGNPEEILLTDMPLIIDIALFLAVAVAAVIVK
jgi:4-hydroxybenzoate polyprenyltransferase